MGSGKESNGSAGAETTATIPALCQYWRSIAKSLPQLRLFGLDVSLTIASALFLGAVRFLAEYVMVACFGWPENAFVTKNAAASVAAIVHSVQLVPALYMCFASCRAYNPSQMMKDEIAEWWEEAVTALLQFCTGYMVYDGLLNIVWLKTHMADVTLEGSDYMFLGHHIATTLYMSSTRFVQAGHQSAMMCMLLGELTNPLHNAFYIAEAALTLECCNGPTAQYLFRYIEISFSGLYVVLRLLIGPAVCLHMTWNLWTVSRTTSRIPMPLLLIWTLLIWGVLIGSIPWIQTAYATLQRYYPDLFGAVAEGIGAEL
jgi:TLC domain